MQRYVNKQNRKMYRKKKKYIEKRDIQYAM